METSSTLDMPLTKFHPFKKLPIELRLRIWGLAAPKPRIITQQKCKNPRKTHCTRVPAVLLACRESRYEYLADANSPISRRGDPTYTLVHVKFPTYFSYEIDTLYIFSHSTIRNHEGFFDKTMIPHIQYLAVDEPALATVLQTLDPMFTAVPTTLKLMLLTAVLFTHLIIHWRELGHIKFESGPGALFPDVKLAPKVATKEAKEWFAGRYHQQGISLVPALAIEHRGRIRDNRV